MSALHTPWIVSDSLNDDDTYSIRDTTRHRVGTAVDYETGKLFAQAPAIPALVEALKTFMAMWVSPDARSISKRAQAKRAAMWDKADAAIAAVEKP